MHWSNVLAILVCAGAHASASELLTVSAQDGMLRRVDATTGATLVATAMTAPSVTVSGANGIARDPLTGAYFALLQVGPTPIRHLATVDPMTAVATILGSTNDAFATLAIAQDGTLYGVTGEMSAIPESLFTLDRQTGAATFVMTLGNGSQGESLTYQPADGLLWHASGKGTLNNPTTGQVLETIDPATLALTPVPMSGGPVPSGLNALVRDSAFSFLGVDSANLAGLWRVGTDGSLVKLTTLDHQVKGLAYVVGPSAFVPLAGGCPGSAGTPVFAGTGEPNPGETITLTVTNGPPAQFGVLLLGTGTGALSVTPACALTIGPVLPGFSIPIATDAGGAWIATTAVPVGAMPFVVSLQAAIADPMTFVAVSNPLRVEVQ